ncbi:ABC transporter permease [Paraburkholderia sp. MM5477-R1]|uniref:ABC transporter permease n=1 Tax=Paraburkholderia sp. MM5477-R1 TaxID=2991062 RepID=UPI003D2357AA
MLLAFITVYPMIMLLYGSLHSTPPGMAGSFNLDGYAAALKQSNLLILANSVGIAVAQTLPSVFMAILLAWIIARTDTPGGRTLEVLITLPFFLPPILTAMAWGMLGNPQTGLINEAWRWLTGSSSPLVNVYSYGGVVWHLMQYSTAFLFLFLVDAFRVMDPSLEEASRMCGGGHRSTFWRITLGVLLPVITSSAILAFIRGIEAFESPVFFGTPAGVKVITTEIYDSITGRTPPDYQYASAIGFVMLALMMCVVLLQWKVLRGKNFQTVTGKGFRPATISLGRWKWLTFAICAIYFLVAVVLPIGQLFIGSFFQFLGFYSLDSLTLDHYRSVFDNADFWRSFRNTMYLGLGGATATMFLGSVIGYITVRTRWPGRQVVDVIAWIPWMLPGIVLGAGFLWAFAMLPAWIPIYGTIWALFLAYLSLGTPVAVRRMTEAYRQLSVDLEECSRVHGATWAQTLVRIMIALAWPSFVVGWVLVFFGIMRELSASILLYSVGNEVMSVMLLKLWLSGNAEEVCVIGLLMIVLVIVFRLLLPQIGGRSKV